MWLSQATEERRGEESALCRVQWPSDRRQEMVQPYKYMEIMTSSAERHYMLCVSNRWWGVRGLSSPITTPTKEHWKDSKEEEEEAERL